jgi:hypothetical protein
MELEGKGSNLRRRAEQSEIFISELQWRRLL